PGVRPGFARLIEFLGHTEDFMDNPVIVSAVRTPIGRFLGALQSIPAQKLGATVVAEAIRRAGITPEQVDEVILGNVVGAGLGQNPARQASIFGGVPDTV